MAVDPSNSTLPNPSLPPPAQQGPTQMPGPLPFNPKLPGQQVADASGRPPRVPYTKTGDMPGVRAMSTLDRMGADPILAGMRDLPPGVWPDAPGYPQMQDVPGIIHGLVTGFGRYASPGIANPMLRAGLGMQMITKDYIAGARGMLALRRDQMLFDMETAAKNHDEQMRDYQEIYHLYGPTYKNGKLVSGNPELFRNKLREQAHIHGDRTLENYLDTGDIRKAEDYLKWLGDNGNDLKKAKALLDYRREEQQIEKNRRGLEDQDDQERPFRGPHTPPSRPPNVNLPSPPPANPNDRDLEWPENPVAPGRPEPTDTSAPTSPEAAQESGAQGGQPRGLAGIPPARSAGPQQPPQQPVRLAMNQPSDVMSDVNPLAGMPAIPPSPDTQTAQAVPPTAAPPVAPSPSVTDRIEAMPQMRGIQIRPVGAPPTAHKPVDWNPPRSKALDEAENSPKHWDRTAVDSLARQLVNGSIKTQDLATIPKAVRAYAQARRLEIERDMDEIASRDDLRGDDVYRALNKINPEYASTLKAYISGDFPVPASAWKNYSYLQRTVGLGSKIDPTFTQSTFSVRAATRKSYAEGQDARNVTSIATLDFHAGRMARDLQWLKANYDPNILEAYIGDMRLGQFLNVPQNVQRIMRELALDSETVANEYQRAITGGKPSVSGRDMDMASLDWRKYGIDNALETVLGRQEFAHDRMTRLVERYLAVIGKNVDSLGQLYIEYAAGPHAYDSIKDELGGTATPTQEAVMNAIRLLRSFRETGVGPSGDPAAGGWSVRKK